MDHTKKLKYISFGVTEEQLIAIEMAVDAGVKARQWCRNIVLEKLGFDAGLTPNNSKTAAGACRLTKCNTRVIERPNLRKALRTELIEQQSAKVFIESRTLVLLVQP